jgi:hypothetical protein
MKISRFEMIDDKTEAEAMSEHQWRTALADAIRRPMGVIPGSAIGLVNATDLAKAEWRRMNGDKDDEKEIMHGR